MQLTSQRILYNKKMISGCTESLDQKSCVCIKDRDIVVFNVETGDELVVFPNVIRQIYTEQIHSLGLIRTGVAFLFKQNQSSASFDLIRIVEGSIKGIKMLVVVLNFHYMFQQHHFAWTATSQQQPRSKISVFFP